MQYYSKEVYYMAYRINDDCSGCGSCEPDCPNEAISQGSEGMSVIDPEKCTECVGSFESSRCELGCGMYACEPDPAHVETREQLLAKWKKLHPSETPVIV